MRHRSRNISIITAFVVFGIATNGVSAHGLPQPDAGTSSDLGDVAPTSGLLDSVTQMTDDLTGSEAAGTDDEDAGLLDNLVGEDGLVDDTLENVVEGETEAIVDDVLATVEDPVDDDVERAAGNEAARSVSDVVEQTDPVVAVSTSPKT